MLTISITQFTGYSTEDFLQYLEIHQPPILEVILPKESDNTIPGTIQVDYCNAAYAGQLLYDLSTDFMHTIPDPDTTGEFSFIIVTTQCEALAALLYFLMAAYTGTGESDEDVQFDCAATDYFCNPGNLNDIACPIFLDVIDRYEGL